MWIIFGLFLGMSLIEDFEIALALGVAAVACAGYEHWKNQSSVKRFDAPPEFKSRMILISWLVDAFVVLFVADSLLPYLHEG